ncbi:MAG TPA: SDR family NAD(P)-dependent oxidoreductase [Solirubrobacteraceae bacterium]
MHPWLADHAVLGTVIVPGTVFLELALHAGARAGAPTLAELVLETPLVLDEQRSLQLQILVGEAGESGSRGVSVYSRLETSEQDDPSAIEDWVRHASGTLLPEDDAPLGQGAADVVGAEWPPAGCEQLALEDLYERLEDAGLQYGPAFRCARAAWRRGEELFVDVAPATEREPHGAAFAIDPVLLDASLHPLVLLAGSSESMRLPFSWSEVRLRPTDARRLRVALSSREEGAVSLVAFDESGRSVLSAGGLVMRPVSAEQLSGGIGEESDSLYRVRWSPCAVERDSSHDRSASDDRSELEAASPGSPEAAWPVLDPDSNGRLALAGFGSESAPGPHRDVEALCLAMQAEDRPTRIALADCCDPRSSIASLSNGRGTELAGTGLEGEPLAHAARTGTVAVLRLVQKWLADERLAEDSLLVIVTCGAVAVGAGEDVPGLAQAPLWGLVRSAQVEAPGRLALLDIDGDPRSWEALPSAVETILAAEESQLALRAGELYTPRLVRGTDGALAIPPDTAHWRVALGGAGTFEDLCVLDAPELADELEPGQVRVQMRAAGLNFRDVLTALGMVPLRGEWESIGGEGAGVVIEVAEGVEDLAPGDRVMGLFNSAFAPQAVVDRRALVPIPADWSFAQAAAVPVAFLTAYYGLVDLGRLEAGERVLVHAAAGGVGMAAVQLARWLGAEVLGTASPPKWGALERLGLEQAQIASSRDLLFKERFLESTDGAGVDVVLNSLANEFVDASLELLGDGGRFLEMGKTDIRDPGAVAERWPGVDYRVFDILEAGPERLQSILLELLALFQQGVLSHLPINVWDLRRAPDALRFMAQAQHVGKIVLTLPPEKIATEGTVLITGGTGVLGRLVAMHLVERHGVRSLVLASRQGPRAPGASELQAELAQLGVELAIVACDVTDREQVRGLLASVPDGRPLRAVVHAAGALDDGSIAALTPERLERVLSVKVDAAWHLHELTSHMDLDAFVMFSSLAGVMGAPGQANYAAANTFLDALAAHRRAQGLPAVSMAWGWWEQATGLTEHLSEIDMARMRRSGVTPISAVEGLRMLDAAWGDVDAVTVPARLDAAALRAQAGAGALPPMLRSLIRIPKRRRQRGSLLAERLRGAREEDARRIVLQVVRGEIAAVLGHSSPEAIDGRRALKELGFDSLLAVELRNRLSAATGMRLPATLVFDYPTAELLAEHMLERSGGAQPASEPAVAVSRAVDEPLAIVGMACRYPGGVRAPEDLWELLVTGSDAMSEFPDDRGWDLERLHDPESLRPNTTYVHEGGFLYDAADFDAGFFGISPREALAMDPQQRLLLEISWEALENGGIRPDLLRGTPTGVFTGTTGQDYSGQAQASPESFEGFLITGISASVLSGRVAYTLGLEGPAISVDTACSSSLVAIQMASHALHAGECSLALAGGVTLMNMPLSFIEFARQRGLAPDGRCKPFADAADGTNWSEGAGMVVLERLSDAQRLGHEVLAVLRGGAINQDGASNGLTAPNGPSQQRVIREALADAGLSAAEVDVVEAHGTGTRLGDPIEAQALLGTYGGERTSERPLWLGSVKSNIGHTQAAAGVAGVIKLVLALRHGQLPRTLHVDEPSTQVDWSSGSIALLREPTPWVANGRPRRAGVSSFGMSGTNAHLILEEAPVAADAIPASAPPPPLLSGLLDGGLVPWPLSGKGASGLRGQAERLRELLATDEELRPMDVGLSLARARARLDDRALLVGGDLKEFAGGLGALSCGEAASNVVEGSPDRGSGLVFVFPGQGSQWAGMAGELLACSPVFAQGLEECAEAFAPFIDWSLMDMLRDQRAPLERVDVLQPLLFAVTMALLDLWRACGVEPDAVVGHSQGEIAAACAAGGLSLRDGARVVAVRSRALAEIEGKGGMVSVALPLQECAMKLERFDGALSVGASNGPGATVVSGGLEALEELLEWCQSEDVRARRVLIAYAAHSTQVEEIRSELLAGCAPIAPRAGHLPFYSSVTGGPLDTEGLDGAYWYRNLREPALFADATRALLERGHRTFIEISPHPVLAMGVQETAEQALEGADPNRVSVVGSLRRDDGGSRRFLLSLGEAWTRGAPVSWETLFDGSQAKRVALPTYAFQRKRYRVEASSEQATSADPDTRSSGFWSAVESSDADGLATTLGLLDEDGRSSLERVLPALASWQRRRQTDASLDGWRYQVAWKRLSDPAATLSGVWPVAFPTEIAEDEWVLALMAALESRGAQVVAVACEQGRARDPRAMAACLQAALAQTLLDGQRSAGENGASTGSPQPAGVISLLALDETFDAEHAAVPRGLAATATLSQTLDELAIECPLWLLTRGAVKASSSDPLLSPLQSMVWGLGRTLGLERPERLAGLVDLPPKLQARSLQRLCGLLAMGGEEDQLAVREAGMFARRLVRAPAQPAGSTESWRPHGTVLVTGATGGVGAHVARWLARRGAEHLLLVSRRGPDAPGIAALRAELEQHGPRVSVVACDVSDRAQVSRLIESIEPECPLDAVIHAAGVGPPAALADLTVEQLQQSLAAKAAGARHLHELTAGMELSAFVLFSSMAAIMGSATQAGYAAANAYLDALAEHRRETGLAATSIAWGLWGGEGAGRLIGERLRRHGMLEMAPDVAIDGLQQALDRNETSLVVMDVEWSVYAPIYAFARRRPLIEDLPEARHGQASPQDLDMRESEPDWAAKLKGLSARGRERAVLELVRSRAAAVMGQDTGGELDVHQPFRELGFDSLMAVELRNRLQSATGLSLPTTVVFDYPSCVELGDHLASCLTGPPATDGADVEAGINSLELALTSVLDESERARTLTRLQALVGRFAGNGQGAVTTLAERIEGASDEEIFGFIDDELGSP